MLMKCNAWSYIIKCIKPKPKISRETQKPQNFWKTPKPRSKMHECMKREKIRTLTKCFDLDLGQKSCGWGDLRVRKSFGSREKVFYRERSEKMKTDRASAIYRKTQLDGLRTYQDLLSTKSWQKWIYRGAIEDLSMAKIPRWIEKLLRSYQDKFQKSRWIKIELTSIKKRRRRGSIDTNLSRICLEVVELEENEFFKERKNT